MPPSEPKQRVGPGPRQGAVGVGLEPLPSNAYQIPSVNVHELEGIAQISFRTIIPETLFEWATPLRIAVRLRFSETKDGADGKYSREQDDWRSAVAGLDQSGR